MTGDPDRGVCQERADDPLVVGCDRGPQRTGGRVGQLEERREQQTVGFASEQQLAAEAEPGVRCEKNEGRRRCA